MQEFPLLCRLCGARTENGLYIYCDEGKQRQVETKIRLYLHFQVVPSDSLPKKICSACFEELEGMHRFAINALKVQDHLAKLSKELHQTAMNVCKSGMTNYVQQPVVQVNDTVASLTNQEVTEMEVQVDPMVFLEDDQIEDCEQGETDEIGGAVPNNQIDPPQNSVEGSIHVEKEHNASLHNGEKLSDEDQADCNKLYVKHYETIEKNKKSLLKLDEKVEQETHAVTQPQQRKKGPSNVKLNSVRNQNNISRAPPNKVLPPLQNSVLSQTQKELEVQTAVPVISEPLPLKSGKKGNASIKNSKKAESKSVSTSENIKCTTYTCPVCKKVLMKRGLFKTHLETHKTDHKYACEICLRVFKKDINLLRHKKSHTELATATNFPCAHCNRVYPTKSTLRSHLVSHSNERPHVCNICSKTFKRNQDLKFHLNQHNGLRPYQCPYCSKSFASSGNCFSHRRRAHMQEIEKERALKNKQAAQQIEQTV